MNREPITLLKGVHEKSRLKDCSGEIEQAGTFFNCLFQFATMTSSG
ncbi:hypothetical protein ACFLUC_00120 [Chloroflexota bacterium]